MKKLKRDSEVISKTSKCFMDRSSMKSHAFGKPDYRKWEEKQKP